MNRFVKLLIVSGVVAWPAWSVLAAEGDAAAVAEKKDAPAPAAAPAADAGKKDKKADLTEFTVSGTIEKMELKGKNGPTEGYGLTTSDGKKVMFPAKAPAKAGKKGSVNPADFVGKKVTVTGMGEEKESKKGGKTIRLMRVKSIKE